MSFVVFSSCKKDEDITDERDKFVGTYETTQTISIPGINYYETMTGTIIVRKSATDQNRIEIFADGSTIQKARVTGNSYVYDKFTETENIDGDTFVIEYTGTGTMNGSIINESGTVVFMAYGESYSGTWQSVMIK